MRETDRHNFEILKKKIVEVMQESYPGINPDIAGWKGQEITDFQEDLRIRVNANISEKWFYTHMKSPNDTLPRIDLLNILSKYAGYANWDEFVFKNGQKIIIPHQEVVPSVQRPPARTNRYFLLVPLLALAVVGVVYLITLFFNTREYQFKFFDADTHELITSQQTEIILLPDGESPMHLKTDPDGCFRLRTDKKMVRMVVKSPYYQVDTIERRVQGQRSEETVMLIPDSYALVIHYFSTMKVDDWERRRNKLDDMIADDAVIYQIIRGGRANAIVLFNKEEFIDKLSLPSSSLRNIEVLATRLRDGKVNMLRFRINDQLR